MEWLDSHCHLDDPRFDPDRAQVVARARAAGVGAIIVPSTTAARWPAVAASCLAGPDIHPAWGLHPMFIDAHAPTDMAALQQQVARQRPVAIGECGLDFSNPQWDAQAQRRVFAGQAGLAQETGLPLIIHARQAVEEVILTLRQHSGVTGVVHSYSGSVEQARQLAGIGIHISLGGPLTHARAQRLHKLVAAVPHWQLLLETDAPDQADAGITGQRNEPARLPHIAAHVARLRQVALSELAASTTANARRLFALPA